MSAYILATYDIVDAEAYEPYVPGVIPLLARHGAEILVADYEAEPLEGDRRTVHVVLRFASREAALAWYRDPDYQPFKKIRLDSSANAYIALARPFEPPPAEG